MKKIHLVDITWSTTEVHDLLSCLSNTHLEYVVIMSSCQLSCSRLPASHTSLITVPALVNVASFRINTLTSTLSGLDVNVLVFQGGCQIQRLSEHQRSKVCHKAKQYYHFLDTHITYYTTTNTIILVNLKIQPISSFTYFIYIRTISYNTIQTHRPTSLK